MDDTQLEHVGMFIKVKTFLSKKVSELAPTPVVTATLAPAFSTAIDNILTEDEDASANISGSTELKRDLRQQVEESAFEVAAACVAYYRITVPNPKLRVKCEFERNDLVRLRDGQFFVDMKKLHEIADPIKALLSDFGVTGTDVDDFGTALTAFFGEIQGPKDAIGERAASGKEVDRLIARALEFLKEQLDVVMKFYVTNNPELHDYYLNARAIDNTGGGPIPDEDYEVTLGNGQFVSEAVPPEVTANSRFVIINGASNGSMVVIGFSNDKFSFTGTQQQVLPGTTGDFKAIDLGFTTGIGFIDATNPGNPNPVSITVRVKVYY